MENPTKIRNQIDRLKDVRQQIIMSALRDCEGFFINHITTYEVNKFREAKRMIIAELNELNKLNKENQ